MINEVLLGDELDLNGHECENKCDDSEATTRTLASDIDKIRERLKERPVWERNPDLCNHVLDNILPTWWKNFWDPDKLNNPWRKIMKRIAKELNECEPCISHVRDLVQSWDEETTILDLGSGFGICSMLLSELLPSSKVNAIWLIDKQWPSHGQSPKAHHISIDHIHGRSWPIPLQTRKVDLKKGRECRQLRKYGLLQGKLLFIGIHLCKALSVHAIKFYQSENADALILKPCCLPGAKALFAPNETSGRSTPIQYNFHHGYSFRPLDIYEQVRVTKELSETDQGEIESMEGTNLQGRKKRFQMTNFSTNQLFDRWVLELSSAVNDGRSDVVLRKFNIQPHHFQNQYIFCQLIRT